MRPKKPPGWPPCPPGGTGGPRGRGPDCHPPTAPVQGLGTPPSSCQAHSTMVFAVRMPHLGQPHRAIARPGVPGSGGQRMASTAYVYVADRKGPSEVSTKGGGTSCLGTNQAGAFSLIRSGVTCRQVWFQSLRTVRCRAGRGERG